MNVKELTRDQLVELKQNYMSQLADEGNFIAVVYDNGEEERGPSYGEIANADTLIPDDVIFDHYADTDFTYDDFFCTSGLNTPVNTDSVMWAIDQVLGNTLYTWVERRDIENIVEAVMPQIKEEFEGRGEREVTDQSMMTCLFAAIKTKLGIED